MVTEQKQLEQAVEKILAEKRNEAYEQLYILLRDKRNEPILRKTTRLGWLREMIERWKEEREEGDSYIFQNINSLKQAEYTYLTIKHGLWRIEQGLSVEKCLPFIEKMSSREQSKYLIAWIAYANLRDAEEVLSCLSGCMMEYDVVSALETLSYGLLLFPNSKELLLQKAQCLMDINMWQEALETLLLVENPQEDIGQLITELEEALK